MDRSIHIHRRGENANPYSASVSSSSDEDGGLEMSPLSHTVTIPSLRRPVVSGVRSRNVPPPLASTALPRNSSSLEADLELLAPLDDSSDQQQRPTSSSNLQQLDHYHEDDDDAIDAHSKVNMELSSQRKLPLTALRPPPADDDDDDAGQTPPDQLKYLSTTREDREMEFSDGLINTLGQSAGGNNSNDNIPSGGVGREILCSGDDDDLEVVRRSVAAAPPRPLLQGPPFDNVFEHPGKFIEGGRIRVIRGSLGGDAESRRLHTSSPIKDVSCCAASDTNGVVIIEEFRVSTPTICCLWAKDHHAFVKRRLVEGVGTGTLISCWFTSSTVSSHTTTLTSTARREGNGAVRSADRSDMTAIEMGQFDPSGGAKGMRGMADQYLYSNSSTTSSSFSHTNTSDNFSSPNANMIGADHIDCGSDGCSTRHVYSAAMGPHQGYLTSTIVMVCTPVVLYIAFTLKDQPPNSVIDVLHILSLFMVAVMLWSLAKTATSNPGYIPKGEPLQEEDDTPKAIKTYADTGLPIDWDTASSTARKGHQQQEEEVEDYDGTRRLSTASSSSRGSNHATKEAAIVERRWCFLCNVYRPLRSSHCEYCNVCVDRRDHHCPWTGTCIGRNNYPWFFTFITSTTICALLGIAVSTASFYLRVDRLRNDRDLNNTTNQLPHTTATSTSYTEMLPSSSSPTSTLNNDTTTPPIIADLEAIPSAWSLLDDAAAETYDMEFIVLLFSCCAFFVVGSLVVYHMGLVLNNTTTREDLRSEFTKDASTPRHHHIASLHKPKYLPSCCMPLYINCTRKPPPPPSSAAGAATRTLSSISRAALSPYDKGSGWGNVVDVLWTPIMSEVRGLNAWEGFLKIGLNITTYK